MRNPNCLTDEELAAFHDEDLSEEQIVGGDDSADSEEQFELSEHESNSEQEASGDNNVDNLVNEDEHSDYSVTATTALQNANDGDGPVYKTKHNLEWSKLPLKKKSKTPAKNICKERCHPLVPKSEISNEISAFEKFINAAMVEEIVRCTNIFIRRKQENYARERDARETNKEEFLAFLGLLILSGVKKQGHTNFHELFSADGTGIEIFRACMSANRFLFLLSVVRFDDVGTRENRRITDKMAAIRHIFDAFVANCKGSYCVGEFMTIDEMLIPFRGRCSFIQYMPNKPAKYGLKIFALCDSKTFYLSNLELYCGKQPDGPYVCENSPQAVVSRLTNDYVGKNRNLTTDNWYTSYPLAEDLLNKKTTLVGTLRKNKKEIPAELLPNKSRPIPSSIFAFRKDMTLVSYCQKKNKAVILLSTMHADDIVDRSSNKPDIVLFYNSTKGGIDTVDEMCGNYSVQKRTRRWPLVLFFQMINIEGINSNIIYKYFHIDSNKQPRRIFLKNVALSLMKPHLETRANIETLPIDIKGFLSKYKKTSTNIERNVTRNRGKCVFCESKKNRVTTITCDLCGRLACKEHVVKTQECVSCRKSRTEEQE